jgi:DNA-binding Lrp family transcriptional regulator
MQQYLILGLGEFGGAVLDRVRALPLEKNIVYHRVRCGPDRPVATHYLQYRQQMLDVLNREVYNFANTQLTVYLVGLMVEAHMAENLMHLGYLFKSFFRENIILNPRVKLISALPTIIPEEAYVWLPATKKALEQLDAYASLKEQFQPAYPDVKRPLPAISGPPFEDVVFCYSESLDEDDVEVSAQAAATKIYFDLAVLPARIAAVPEVQQFYRSFPAGQPFLAISGCAVAFLPSLAKLLRDEMEYVVLLRLCEAFLPSDTPGSARLDPLLDDLMKTAKAGRLEDVLRDVATHALQNERWFDLAAIDALAKYDIEMSPPPDAYLQRYLASLETERNRFAGRVRDLALEKALLLPERLLERLRSDHTRLNLREIATLYTNAFFRIFQVLEQRKALLQKLKNEWQRTKSEIESKVVKLKALAAEKGARLKKGSETEARIKEVFATVVCRDVIEQFVVLTAAEALAGDDTLEARLRESYERVHGLLASFLAKRDAVLTHLRNRRDASLRRREMYLYVFNQVFRERVLDAEIQRKLKELSGSGLGGDVLAEAVGTFFFKRWLHAPDLAMDEVEKALTEAIRQHARAPIEAAAASMQVKYADVVRILREVADAHVSSIFDMKYKEHPQAAYRQSMFLCHRDETLTGVSGTKPGGFDLTDVAHVPDLPFQVLQVMEIHNLPFRALRQYASFDRHTGP